MATRPTTHSSDTTPRRTPHSYCGTVKLFNCNSDTSDTYIVSRQVCICKHDAFEGVSLTTLTLRRECNMGPGSGLALDGGGARAVVLTLGSVLNVKQLLLKSLLLFLLNVNTKTIRSVLNVRQLYPRQL